MHGQQTHDTEQTRYDVAVIGGGASGLSGALVLGRARRSVVVIDAGTPRNAPAAGVHAFLTRENTPPRELIEIGRGEVEQFGVKIVEATAESAARTEHGFAIELDNGSTITARRLLVTTGLVDELPDLPGLRERWGHDVLHCPYCHGWEVRDQPIGILGGSARAVHQALLFRQWSNDITLFTHTGTPISADEAEQLAARDITVVDGAVEGLEVVDDRLRGVRLADGRLIERTALVVATRMVAQSTLLAGLGLTPTEDPNGMGEFIAADPTGMAAPGIWVAGNVTDLRAQVIVAAAGAVNAAAMLNVDLVGEDTRRAVTAGQHDRMWSADFWNERYGSSDQIWSGRPNQRLVEQVESLPAGRALDIGSGEGADAIWLAQQGWQVTAVDVSTVALERAAGHAAAAGLNEQVSWQPVDIRTWVPPEASFDLVSAQFMHLPRSIRAEVNARLAAAVRPGGSLLIVGHDFADTETAIHRPHEPDLFFTADEVAAGLDPAEWEIVFAGTPTRSVTGPDGEPVEIADAVVHALRR